MSRYQARWDPTKAESNLRKHGVSFEEAAVAVNDMFAIARSDEHHSILEDRFVLIGESAAWKTLTVIFTMDRDTVRIISARRANAAERRRYMEGDDVLRDAPMDDEMLDDYGHLDGWKRMNLRIVRDDLVHIDEDVQKHFRTSEEVNDALRSLIAEGRVPSATRK